MAIVTGTATINGILTDISIDIPTIRIPELPAADMPFDPLDKFPMYDSSLNKTAWVGSADLLPYLTGGGTIPIVPIVNGSNVEIRITAGMAGTNQCNVPALAGFTFLLERRGRGKLLSTEYSILTSGGFQLADGADALQEGEVFFADVFNFMAPSDPTNLTSLVSGMAVVSSSITLSQIHFNKLIHIAAGTSIITITLPDLVDAPDNLIMIFETTITNSHKTRIQGNSGQVLYYGDTSNSAIYIGVDEYVWLYKGADGWYVIASSSAFQQVGEIFYGYKAGLNTLPCTGGLILRAEEPRLWDWVQGLGSSLVIDAFWGSGSQGQFSTGDGSTTFRLPDLRNQFIRGLKTIGGGFDSERPSNIAGGKQDDLIRTHTHPTILTFKNGKSDQTESGTQDQFARNPAAGGDNYGTWDYVPTSAPTGGAETRPTNIGLIPLIRT